MIKMGKRFLPVKIWAEMEKIGLREVDISTPFANYKSDRKYIYCYAIDLQLYWDEFDEIIPCVGEWKLRSPFVYDTLHAIQLWETKDLKAGLEYLIRVLGYYYHYKEEYRNPEVTLPIELLWDEEEVINRRSENPYPYIVTCSGPGEFDLPF